MQTFVQVQATSEALRRWFDAVRAGQHARVGEMLAKAVDKQMLLEAS